VIQSTKAASVERSHQRQLSNQYTRNNSWASDGSQQHRDNCTRNIRQKEAFAKTDSKRQNEEDSSWTESESSKRTEKKLESDFKISLKIKWLLSAIQEQNTAIVVSRDVLASLDRIHHCC
jgi:hypothetical protein